MLVNSESMKYVVLVVSLPISGPSTHTMSSSCCMLKSGNQDPIPCMRK